MIAFTFIIKYIREISSLQHTEYLFTINLPYYFSYNHIKYVCKDYTISRTLNHKVNYHHK